MGEASPGQVTDPRVPQRVLVVRLGAIGDVVNALLFATALREARPGMHLAWVVHPLAAPLVEGHPSVDRVHLWRRGGGLGEFHRLVGELRAGRYELAVDLQRIQKSALLARLSGATRVLGYERGRTKELSWLWTNEHVRVPPGTRHMVELTLDAARHLGCDSGVPRHLFPSDAAAEDWAEERIREFGAAPVLVNIGASKPANRWEPERFGRLVQALARAGDLPVCLTGGPDDRPSAARALAVSGAGVHDLVGRTSLRQLVAFVRRARLFVGCDTGPMHLAAAVRTPVVALFGSADPARTGPHGPGHRVVSANGPGPARMEDLTVEQVLAAVHASLASPGACRSGR